MDEIDKRVIDYNKGFIAGQEHSKPSNKTLGMFSRLEKKMSDDNKELQQDMKTLIINVATLTGEFKGLKDNIIIANENIAELYHKHEDDDDRITALEIEFSKSNINNINRNIEKLYKKHDENLKAINRLTVIISKVGVYISGGVFILTSIFYFLLDWAKKRLF